MREQCVAHFKLRPGGTATPPAQGMEIVMHSAKSATARKRSRRMAINPTLELEREKLRFSLPMWHPLVTINHGAWAAHPSLCVVEAVFCALALRCWIHAASGPRWRLVLLAAALVGGGTAELLTVLPRESTGSVYHSSGMVMLFGNREPAYMLLGCCPVLPYLAVVLARGCEAPAAVEAALAALALGVAWGLLDTVGAKHLWWTRHNGEPLYADRVWGVPVASSFWTMASGGALAVALRLAERAVAVPTLRPAAAVAVGALVGPAATCVPFLAIYCHPLVSYGGHYALAALAAVAVAPVLVCSSATPRRRRRRRPSHLGWAVALYVAAMTAGVAWVAPAPETVVRRSFGQPYLCASAADPLDPELTEAEQAAELRARAALYGPPEPEVGVCAHETDPRRDQYTFRCLALPEDEPEPGAEWYPVCGTPIEPGWRQHVALEASALLLLLAAAELCVYSSQPKADPGPLG